MQSVSAGSLIYYCLFSVFVFYQQLHVKNFRGTSQAFIGLLSLSAIAGMITGVTYLIYYSTTVSVLAAVIIFFLGLLSAVVGFVLERMISALTISMVGLVGWPICAYMMFATIPSK